ncbi:DUF1761 domain-containing protein [Leptospira hartskeerlii]|uniref:DUF1761 domain-containing protein n=1 Tax=Leptospira hartskeerlii TaxID=2023177 RepID=A0A2M9XCE3_9LEPT|nr:DUF1761 domain-containing protein [Leptospira hartskeerlii]PJZ25232.1 DUF1761 domain-containing protein [Leptospira hartskeerlii]PJZ33624.1 DUF1761 domain-containing protein [Leptospira hartskeerlii]
MKKFIMAVLGYLLPSFVLGVLWHFVFFKELYDSFGIYNRKDPIIALGFSTMLIQGVVLAYLYPYFKSLEARPIIGGLKFGLIFGTFLYSVSTMANAAKIEVVNPISWFAIQAVFHFLQFGISGILIGLAYKGK